MANIKSALKRARQIRVRTERNKARRSTVRTAIRRFKVALLNKDVEAIQSTYREACRQLDKAVSKGVLHRNAAARKKSRLAKKIS